MTNSRGQWEPTLQLPAEHSLLALAFAEFTSGRRVPALLGFADRGAHAAELGLGGCVGEAGPMPRVHAVFHPTMKARPFPFVRTSDVPVLHRIEVDVVEVLFEVVFVFDGMFPESTLPNSTTVFGALRLRNRLLAAPLLKPAAGEFPLDAAPARGVSSIPARHRPNGMKMIVQQDDRVDLKRPIRLTSADDLAK